MLASLMFLSRSSFGYDQELAKRYAKLFQPVTGAESGKALHLMMPDKFMEEQQQNNQLVTIDIRTPNEFSILSMTLPGSMMVPVSELFKKENLKRIPVDKKVVIICKSGTRATAAGTALRYIGFDNVYILKGGLMALSKYLSPKTANPQPKTAMR
jgi:rhodanese-related sulfurtransferase